MTVWPGLCSSNFFVPENAETWQPKASSCSPEHGRAGRHGEDSAMAKSTPSWQATSQLMLTACCRVEAAPVK